jgi:hypothetical protein
VQFFQSYEKIKIRQNPDQTKAKQSGENIKAPKKDIRKKVTV